MSTEAGVVLEPHQIAVDCQELKRLHWLMGALLGTSTPAAVGVPTESVPYSLPAVDRGSKKCPICHQVFKMVHCMRRHMDVHKGTGYPCSRCHKSLASKMTLRQHEQACKKGERFNCDLCDGSYASLQILKQHHKAKHGAGAPEPGEAFFFPFCSKQYAVKKSMQEHAGVCEKNPNHKGPYFCWVAGCSKADHPFQKVKNLNQHLDWAYGWREHWE